MSGKSAATQKLSQHLHAAIERVREDVAKVEFWADAMTGFNQPVPNYEPSGVKVWLPSEQARRLSASDNNKAEEKPCGGTPGGTPEHK
jgi:hypothetical protein